MKATKRKNIETVSRLQQVLRILQPNIDTIEKLQYELGNSYQDIEEFLEYPSRLKKCFPDSVYQVLLKKIQELNKEQQERKKIMQQIQKYDTYLSIYLTSCYNQDEMEVLTEISKKQLRLKLENGFIERYYSKDIMDKIKLKKKEVNRIKGYPHSKTYPIKDAMMISFVKPEITQISNYEFNSLNILKDFFQTFGDIEKLFFEKGSIPNYNYALSVLQDVTLHKILKPEVQERLVEMLEVEKQMKSLKMPKRKKLLDHVVEAFYRYNGNICILLENIEVSNFVLLRALEDRLIIGIYGQKVYQDIQDAFQVFQDKNYVLDELKKAKVKKYQKEGE